VACAAQHGGRVTGSFIVFAGEDDRPLLVRVITGSGDDDRALPVRLIVGSADDDCAVAVGAVACAAQHGGRIAGDLVVVAGDDTAEGRVAVILPDHEVVRAGLLVVAVVRLVVADDDVALAV